MKWFASVMVLGLVGCGAAQPVKPVKPPKAAAKPKPVDPGVVTLAGGAANAYVPADVRSELLVRFRVAARSLPDSPRPPINVALVVDTSGSMQGQPIERARQAAVELVDALKAGDRVSVVAFHARAEVVVPATVVEPSSAAPIKAKISAMRARGTTDLANGLSQGLAQVRAGRQQGGVDRVVLLSDGVPNDAAPIAGLADAAGRDGISITALGLGIEYDETLLGQIAQRSGGRFHYIEATDAVAQVFADEVLRMERVVARRAQLVFSPGPGVHVLDVPGQSAQRAGRGSRVQLGDLGEGEARDVVVKLAVTGKRTGAVVELLDARLDFVDALAGAGALNREAFVAARTTDEPEALATGRDPEVERDAFRALAAHALVQAVALQRANRTAEARALLIRTAESLAAAAERLDDAELRRQMKALAELKAALPEPPPPAALRVPPRRGPVGRGGPAPRPSAGAARSVRRLHGQAMGTLQGR